MRIFADDIDAIVLQMIKIRLFLLLLIAGTLQGFAQRRLVVVDVETLIPVVGANVISKDGNCTTDSLGYFSVSDSCKTLSFSHVNYESRLVNLNEVRDTVFMISKLLKAAIDPSSGNLLSLFAYLIPKKWRKNSKEARRKRMKQILDNY